MQKMYKPQQTNLKWMHVTKQGHKMDLHGHGKKDEAHSFLSTNHKWSQTATNQEKTININDEKQKFNT